MARRRRELRRLGGGTRRRRILPGAVYTRIWKESCKDLEAPEDHVIKESATWRSELVDSDVALELAFSR